MRKAKKDAASIHHAGALSKFQPLINTIGIFMFVFKNKCMKLIISYVLTMLVFFAIDIVWIGGFAKNFYWGNMGSILKDDINWIAALVFYLLYIFGIFVFAILPAVENDSLQHAMLYGALFGFFCYATYDLTNLATLKGFPLKVVVVDMIWGTILTGSVATAGFYITRWVR